LFVFSHSARIRNIRRGRFYTANFKLRNAKRPPEYLGARCVRKWKRCRERVHLRPQRPQRDFLVRPRALFLSPTPPGRRGAPPLVRVLVPPNACPLTPDRRFRSRFEKLDDFAILAIGPYGPVVSTVQTTAGPVGLNLTSFLEFSKNDGSDPNARAGRSGHSHPARFLPFLPASGPFFTHRCPAAPHGPITGKPLRRTFGRRQRRFT